MLASSRALLLEPLEGRTLLSTCHVVRLDDLGAGNTIDGFSRGDLRYCVIRANNDPGPDLIKYSPGVSGSIVLGSPLPHITDDLNIVGPGANLLTIDGRKSVRLFYVEAGVRLEISNLTFANGYVSSSIGFGGAFYNKGTLIATSCSIIGNFVHGGGGAIYNEGSLTMLACWIHDNESRSYLGPPSTSGGAIYNLGIAEFKFSSITSNTVDGRGGAIYNSTSGTLLISHSLIHDNFANATNAGGGGIFNRGQASITNSTIANNKVAGYGNPDNGGAGIHNDSLGILDVRHSTISANHAYKAAGGIYNAGTFYMSNTILAKNYETNGPDYDLHGHCVSVGYNLVGDIVNSGGFLPSDMLHVDPMLGALQFNGGDSPTMELLPGSPAIDAGDPNVVDPPEWDQRGPGFPRIVNGTIDIGAFEVQATGAPPASIAFAVLITADFGDIY